MFKNLITKTIEAIYMNADQLIFEVEDGYVSFVVDGDCCSYSTFYDFLGIKNILGKKVLVVEEIDVDISPKEIDDDDINDSIEVYGFRIIVEDEVYGELTGVFSFRNFSNGYYGGSLEGGDLFSHIENLPPELLNDCLSID